MPDLDTKLRTLRGEATGWDYRFKVPDTCTAYWSDHDWVIWIGDRWFRKG